ncbi:molybdopterin-dependent oxidoreductase [Caldivirga maquilingensis]|uniref:Oxidoreductase molybdopterin binding n=1 Tax=Caldivirga maquilingensis (strain ATCC 700844 / DSM 13496 / JCM 10307 / IC-167) TaxID=397948 RepID=A8M985_CALMQ|nr:molybdopterin-dependent oxidoreductase [Caldivirga maquilingensis]ABW02304.1 oxidoreductase molybdopterin binding [Caldivirga maquilingensis IC-167]
MSMDRRKFLALLLGTGATALAAGSLQRILSNSSPVASRIEEVVGNATTSGNTTTITAPSTSHISAIKKFPTKPPANATSTTATNSTTPVINPSELTPLDEWYIVQIGPTQYLNINNYVLTVDGLVENPLQLTYSDLLKMPSKTILDTIQCVSDSYFLKATVEWTGVPLKYILNEAGVKEGAVKVISYAADGYTSDLPLWKAMEDDTLVAYMADEQPLLHSHGYPVRLVVPRWWGYKYTKWLIKLTVTNENYLGYWESDGYPDIARKSNGA